MRRIFAVLALLVCTSASAQSFRFDPPAPTSRTPVTATLYGLWGDGCPPLSATATVLPGNVINLRLEVSQFPCNLIPIRAVEYRVSAYVGLLPAGVYRVQARVRDTGPLIASEAQLLVRDATPALTVAPSVIFATGSQKVRIHAPGMGTCPPIVSPCFVPKVSVTFNGIPAVSVTIVDSDTIDAVVPRLEPAGVIAIVVSTDDGRRVESGTALYVTPPIGYPIQFAFERILIPVLFSGPGAYGAQWTTDAWVENASSYDVQFFRPPFLTPPCAAPLDCNFPPIAAGQIRRVDSNWPNGVFIYPERGADIRVNVLVRDLSRQSEALGTEVPVVREEDWKTGPVSLLNVPADSRYRVSLRVYLEDEQQSPLPAAIRITRMDGKPVADGGVPLLATLNGLVPPMGFIGDLATKFNIPAGDPLRVEVRAPDKAGRFWAFISVTNNSTQHVTIISPQ